MNESFDLTTGRIGGKLVRFALPYLLAAFMQTFYGMADLFVVGLYNDASATTAVSVGSQIMHMLTVIILGLAMGTTVRIARHVGAGDRSGAARAAGNSVTFFALCALIATPLLLLLTKPITALILTPAESVAQTVTYLRICFVGVPFIVAYNVISSIFRGAGDSKHPMIFVAVACAANIALDFLFIGALGMGAAGAALGTVLGQSLSVIISLPMFRRTDLGFKMKKTDLAPRRDVISGILKVGTPIACQDGFIQVTFMVITVIANSRGVIAAAGVGIVEKIICFLFLVPSSFLSAISAFTAQNMGAKKPDRAEKGLYWGLAITGAWGILVGVYCQFLPHTLVGAFTRDAAVIIAGCGYLRSYGVDTFFAAIHFCFSGFFTGAQRSSVSFIHNLFSILLLRIPFSYYFSLRFPDTLFPMGCAAPMGSILSDIICIVVFVRMLKKRRAAA